VKIWRWRWLAESIINISIPAIPILYWQWLSSAGVKTMWLFPFSNEKPAKTINGIQWLAM